MIPTLLLVDDNEDDVFFMSRAIKEAGVTCNWRVVADGQQAIDYLSGKGEYADRTQFPLPQVVYLDLKLPIVPGLEVLQWIRRQPDLTSLVIIVLTGSEAPIDFNRAFQLGANSMMSKPAEPSQMLNLLRTFRVLGTPPFSAEQDSA